MEQILLIGHDENENARIFQSLNQSLPDYHVRVVRPDRQSIKECFTNETSLAIFNYSQLANQNRICEIRDSGFEKPIVLLSKNLPSLQSDEKTVHIAKPYADNDLINVSKKYLNGETIAQRFFKRFRFQQTVGIESFGVSGKTAAQMLTISKGGALLELRGHSVLQPRDILQVHVCLNDLKRYHIMLAQVVYSDGGGCVLPGERFGVSWLNGAKSDLKKIA